MRFDSRLDLFDFGLESPVSLFPVNEPTVESFKQYRKFLWRKFKLGWNLENDLQEFWVAHT